LLSSWSGLHVWYVNFDWLRINLHSWFFLLFMELMRSQTNILLVFICFLWNYYGLKQIFWWFWESIFFYPTIKWKVLFLFFLKKLLNLVKFMIGNWLRLDKQQSEGGPVCYSSFLKKMSCGIFFKSNHVFTCLLSYFWTCQID